MGIRIQNTQENMVQVNEAQAKSDSKSGRTQKSGQQESIFGGDLNLGTESIEEKKKKAQQQAWKLIEDAWSSDRKTDESVAERKSYYEEMKKQMGGYQGELNRINRSREELKETYHVEDGSEEQKDLELLEKREYYRMGDHSISFSEEEQQRLAFLDESGMTEYQERSLDYARTAYVYNENVNDTKKQLADDASDMRAIAIERLKSHGMVDAQKSAQELLAASSKEIIGDLMEEAKNNVDEKQEEEEKKQEEQKKEKEEEEARLDEIKEKRAIQEALIEGTKEAAEEAKRKVEQNNQPEMDMDNIMDIAQNYQSSGDVQQGLDDIKNSMKLLEADLKGVKVDQQV